MSWGYLQNTKKAVSLHLIDERENDGRKVQVVRNFRRIYLSYGK